MSSVPFQNTREASTFEQKQKTLRHVIPRNTTSLPAEGIAGILALAMSHDVHAPIFMNSSILRSQVYFVKVVQVHSGKFTVVSFRALAR